MFDYIEQIDIYSTLIANQGNRYTRWCHIELAVVALTGFPSLFTDPNKRYAHIQVLSPARPVLKNNWTNHLEEKPLYDKCL